MTQMPLWGEPDPPKNAPKDPVGQPVVRPHKGIPTTCHMCLIDIARGARRHPRDLAGYEVTYGDWSWLTCSNHARDVRGSIAALSPYMTGGQP